MPTFYLRTRTGLACKKAGRRHAAYIAGKQQYCDKSEVKFIIDKNLPTWANNADEFFAAADENERANGRSYRSIVFAIPHEAPDKKQWSQQLVDQLLGERHAYRLAIHIPDDGHNPHAHLMFSERGLKDLEASKFFSRSNAKNPIYSGNKSKQWLERAKRHYLALIRVLCPAYTPPNRGEQKVGPKLLNPSPVYEELRHERERTVLELRRDSQELQSVMEEIARLPKTPRYSVFEAIQAALEGEQGVGLDEAVKRFKPSSRACRTVMTTTVTTAPQIQRSRPKFR
jgi:hypothetical protein